MKPSDVCWLGREVNRAFLSWKDAVGDAHKALEPIHMRNARCLTMRAASLLTRYLIVQKRFTAGMRSLLDEKEGVK